MRNRVHSLPSRVFYRQRSPRQPCNYLSKTTTSIRRPRGSHHSSRIEYLHNLHQLHLVTLSLKVNVYCCVRKRFIYVPRPPEVNKHISTPDSTCWVSLTRAPDSSNTRNPSHISHHVSQRRLRSVLPSRPRRCGSGKGKVQLTITAPLSPHQERRGVCGGRDATHCWGRSRWSGCFAETS